MTPGMAAVRFLVPKLVGKSPRRPVWGLLGPFGPWAPWALGPGSALYIVASREGTSWHARCACPLCMLAVHARCACPLCIWALYICPIYTLYICGLVIHHSESAPPENDSKTSFPDALLSFRALLRPFCAKFVYAVLTFRRASIAVPPGAWGP